MTIAGEAEIGAVLDGLKQATSQLDDEPVCECGAPTAKDCECAAEQLVADTDESLALRR